MSKKILIIEDDEAIANNLAVALNGDYDIRLASTAASGLALAREKIPDLILVDRQLPDMTGLEVLRQLKEEESFREIPIVVLSDQTDPKTNSGVIAFGGKECWSKVDLSLQDMVSGIKALID